MGILLADSSLVDLTVMLVLPVERLLSIPMVGGAPMVVELSLERIPPKSIDLLRMLLDGLQNLLSPLVYATESLSNCLTPLVAYPLSIHVDTYGTCKRSGKSDTDLV